MVESNTKHVLDPLFAWAHGIHREATEQPGYHGEMTMKVAYANGRITLIEKLNRSTEKPTN